MSSGNVFISPLDTKAQVGTKEETAICKKAKSKYFSYHFISKLASLRSPLQSSYRNSLKCCNEIEVSNNIAKSKYCKNKWCFVCCKIRTAVLVSRYEKSLNTEINKAFFVTLTIPNVFSIELEKAIKEMFAVFKTISEKQKKRYQRYINKEKQNRANCCKRYKTRVLKKKPVKRHLKAKISNLKTERLKHQKNYKVPEIKLKSVLKLEITYNSKTGTFHPHFHTIVNTEKMANFILHEWLKRFPDANRISQDVQKADVNSKMELFKYTTKLISQLEDFEKGKKVKNAVFVDAMDCIYRVLHKKRTLRTYGFKLDIEENFTDDDLKAKTEVKAESGNFNYFPDLTDWINTETGETLANWQPGAKEENFIKCFKFKKSYFLPYYINRTELINIFEAYKFKVKFKKRRDYLTYIRYNEYELKSAINDMFLMAKKLGFDDIERIFERKCIDYIENFIY